ncbi:MAG: hypothetical protein Q7T50_00635 [Candidatus Magasanikbacteria bacterium]|nr:hypothetical protein [Candidatus Magasanikbacteria bacterium]
MGKIPFLKNNWFSKFLLVRKLNLEFHGKRPTQFTVVFAKNTELKDLLELKDVGAISFSFDKGPNLAIIFTDDGKKEEEYRIFIKSVFEAWPHYRVHGFGIIDFVFRDTLSLLEKNKGRKILKLRYSVLPYTYYQP